MLGVQDGDGFQIICTRLYSMFGEEKNFNGRTGPGSGERSVTVTGLPVASWKSEDGSCNLALPRPLSLHPILVRPFNNVLLFSLLLLLPAEVSFLSRQSDIPTQYIIPLTFPLRPSLTKTPRSSLLLMMSSTSLCPITPHLLSHRWLKASIPTHHHRPTAHERTSRRDCPCQREASHYALCPTPSFSFKVLTLGPK